MSNYSFDVDTARPASRPEPDPIALPASPSRGYPEQPEMGGDAEVSLVDYLKVLYKRRWTAVTIFLLIVGGVSHNFSSSSVRRASARLCKMLYCVW